MAYIPIDDFLAHAAPQPVRTGYPARILGAVAPARCQGLALEQQR